MTQNNNPQGCGTIIKNILTFACIIAVILFIILAISGNLTEGFFGTLFICIAGAVIIVTIIWLLIKTFEDM